MREQLKGRMVEEKAWDLEVEQKPIEDNVYFSGLNDDRLEQYKQQIRDQKLEEVPSERASCENENLKHPVGATTGA